MSSVAIDIFNRYPSHSIMEDVVDDNIDVVDDIIPRKYKQLYYITSHNVVNGDFLLNVHDASQLTREMLESDETIVYGPVVNWRTTMKTLIYLSNCKSNNKKKLTQNNFMIEVHPFVLELFRTSEEGILLSHSFSVRA